MSAAQKAGPREPENAQSPYPDPSKPIECTCLCLSTNDSTIFLNNTDRILTVGQSVRAIAVNGVVERITLHPNGTYVIAVRCGLHSMKVPEELRAKYKLGFLVFREGHAEVRS